MSDLIDYGEGRVEAGHIEDKMGEPIECLMPGLLLQRRCYRTVTRVMTSRSFMAFGKLREAGNTAALIHTHSRDF